jgi:hypothetical protein
MPGPIEPDWGVPQAFLSASNGSTWNSTSGALVSASGVSRLPRFARDGQLQWELLADSEVPTGVKLPTFPIEDSATAAILIGGTYDASHKTVKYQNVFYNLSMQRSPASGKDVAVAVVA